MRKIVKFLYAGILAAFSVAACGGGGGGSGGGPGNDGPVASYNVNYIGDSTVRGYVSAGSPGSYTYSIITDGAPYNLQQYLVQAHKAYARVTNNGVGGSTINELINGTAPETVNYQTMLNTDAKIVIENFGINDAGVPVTPASFTNDLTTFVTYAQSLGKTVVIEEPNPVCDNTTHSNNLDALVTAANAVATTYGLQVIHQYAYIKSQANWQTTLMSPDCVHPSEALYKMKADNVFAVLSTLVP